MRSDPGWGGRKEGVRAEATTRDTSRATTRISPAFMVILATALTLVLSMALSAGMVAAADADIHITQDLLPYTQNIDFDITGNVNDTINITYDNWLTGPGQVTFNDPMETITATLTIPTGTATGNYTRNMLFSDGSHKAIAVEVRQSLDQDHDGYSPPQDCNDNDPAMNPGRQEIPYNGKDDDCNPATPDDFTFTTQLSSGVVNIGEPLNLRILAPTGANVTIQVCEQGSGFVPCYLPFAAQDHTFPAQALIPNTNTSGAYTVTATMKYNQATRTSENPYTVQNSLTVNIEGNTEVDQGETITLASIATGGIPPYTYKWYPEGKTAIDGPLMNISYDTNGARTVTLNVKDKAKNERNTTFTVQTKRLYPVTVAVVDNDTGLRIPNIKVSVHDKTLTTSANGDATFQLSESTYYFTAFDDNYDYAKVQYRIDRDTSFTMKLIKKDVTPPAVTLKSPAGTPLPQGDTPFTFSYQDASTGSCDLAVGIGNFYLVKGSIAVAAAPTAKDYTVTADLAAGTYSWKVECRDAKGNKGTSAKWTILVTNTTNASASPGQDAFSGTAAGTTDTTADQAAPAAPPDAEGKPNLLQALYDGLDRKKDFTMNEQEAAEAILFEKSIQQALTTIERVNRDVNDLKFRHDLTDQEKIQKDKEYKDTLDRLYTAVPVNLKVLDSTQFVKYPSDEDYAAIAQELYGADVKNELKNLQNKATISTRAMHITLTYADRSTKEATLIIHDLSKANLTKEDILLEYVPADLGSGITFITQATKKKDGIYQYEETLQQYSYLIFQLVPFDKAQEPGLILAKEKLAPGAVQGTGNAIVAITANVSPKTALIIIIIIGIIAYLIYSTDTLDKVFRREKRPKVGFLIQDALSRLNSGDKEGCDLLLQEIQLTYEALPPQAQGESYPLIEDLCGQMDVAYVEELNARCMNLLAEGKHEDAVSEFAKIKEVFEALRAHEQEQVYKDLVETHNAILHHGTLD